MAEPSAPHPSAGADAPPRTYLGWGLAATLLCFLPLGLVALYRGMRVQRAVAEGRLDVAARQSRSARRWLVATVVVGALVWLVIAGALALLGAFSSS